MDLITTHFNADFDGLASMVAAKKLYPEATLVLSGGGQEHVRQFLARHDVGITRLRNLDLTHISRLILVDTQDFQRLGPLQTLSQQPDIRIHIYDHHLDSDGGPSSLPQPRVELQIIEPVGASITVLCEQLQKSHIALTPFEATVMAIGLYEETGFLSYHSTTPRDIESAAYLLRAGADLHLVRDTLRPHLDPDRVALLHDLLQSSETYSIDGHDVLLATSTYDRYRGDLAEPVHQLAELENYDAVLAAISLEEKVEIIGRSRCPAIHVGQLLKAFGGGGHAEAASAVVKGQTIIEVREKLAHLLEAQTKPHLQASDIMTTPVKTIIHDATIAEAEQQLTRHEVNALPVVDEHGNFQGIITREIVQKGLFHHLHDAPISTLMHTEIYTADPATPFHEVESHMLERNQRLVPILKDQRVVGVITRTDLLRTMYRESQAARQGKRKGPVLPTAPARRHIRHLLYERLPPETVKILEEAGELAKRLNMSVYAVGGFVRDLLLEIPDHDLDLVVEGDGIAFAETWARQTQAHVTIHERFGTAVMTFPNGFKLDIATARSEYYEYPTALPTVERSSIKKDLYRRDFTINTLAIQLHSDRFGELLDFYGGQRDIKEKKIRVLHSLSFIEDPTRIIRAIRFAERFGFDLGKETMSLMKHAISMNVFHRLSKSRLLEELILLFSEDDPIGGIIRLVDLQVFRVIHPTLTGSPRLTTLLHQVKEALDWHKLSYFPRHLEPWLVYLMALTDAIPEPDYVQALQTLSLSARHMAIIRESRRADDILSRLGNSPSLKPSEVYRLLEGLSEETFVFLMAKAPNDVAKRHISAYLTSYRQTKPPFTGENLKALGFRPGPQYKTILSTLLDATLDGDITNEEEARTFVLQHYTRP